MHDSDRVHAMKRHDWNMCCGNCGFYFRESLFVCVSPDTFLNLYFMLAYLRSSAHRRSHAKLHWCSYLVSALCVCV